MNWWDWEFFGTEVKKESYVIADHGPLFGPVTDFAIVRGDDLQLILSTTSAMDSKSNAVEQPAGSVYISTAEVKLQGRYNTSAVATGVIPRSFSRHHTFDSRPGTTKQTASIHSLRWIQQDAAEARWIIEWVENLSGSHIWPHFDDLNSSGERRRKLSSPAGEVVLSVPIDSMANSRSCVHLVIEGVELFLGASMEKIPSIRYPGFILYRGTPHEGTRSKIRDCLSFCLGNFLVYLGDTTFDAEWLPVAFNAKSGHALVENSPRLTGMQPSPLGLRWEFEVTPELLCRMASSLYRVYDSYDLQGVFWNYWHAVAAPVHMAAVHFGSAIEGLQTSYFKALGSTSHGKILEKETDWRELYARFLACISEAQLPAEVKTLFINKTQNLNTAPQRVVMERLFRALNLELGPLESDVWVNRNRAAHGASGDSDVSLRLVRENNVLLVILNRILLSLGNGSDFYYDYYNLGRPTMRLAEPVRDDRAPGAHLS